MSRNQQKTQQQQQQRRLMITVVLGFIVATSEGCRSGELLATGITDSERYEILRVHNELRQQVAMGQVNGQPMASNMQEMHWDAELARRAQDWANQCHYDHDPNRFDDRFSIGQNLAIIWSSAPLEIGGDFDGRVRKWFNEVAIYRWGQGWSVRTGHYSQMVWAGTNLVGCGFSYYRQAGQYKKLYVCNYGPAGNVAGRLPYQPGYPQCTGYGMETSNSYPGLCQGEDYENSIDGVNRPYVYNPYSPGYTRPNAVANYYRSSNSQNARVEPSYTQNSISTNYYQQQTQQDTVPEVNIVTYTAPSSVAAVGTQNRRHSYTSPNSNNANSNSNNNNNNDRPLNKLNQAFNTYRWDLLFKNFIKEIV